jgi:hypothetical protein
MATAGMAWICHSDRPRSDGNAAGRLFHPYFHPYNWRTAAHRDGCLRNVLPAQGTCTDVGERPFGIYDLFEGTEQIQQLVISRAISGVHIR